MNDAKVCNEIYTVAANNFGNLDVSGEVVAVV